MGTNVPSVANPKITTARISLLNTEDNANPVAIAETVKKMRQRKGLTLTEASASLGKQKSWASKIETGRLHLQSEDLIAYASILEIPPTLLTVDLPSVDAQGLMFRKYRTPQRTVNMLSSEASLRLHVVNTILDVAKQQKAPTFKQFKAESNTEVLSIARQIRSGWGLSPNQPLTNLSGQLEKEGIILSALPVEIEKVNGVSYWHDEQTAPITMLTNTTIDNTKRFTLAHEYAHLVLDKFSPEPGETPKHLESRADLFAGELLAPYQSVRNDFLTLRTGDLDGLLAMSRYWGIHPSSFVTRASHFGDISKDQAATWYKRLNGSIRQVIEKEQAPYPVRFTAMTDILNYLSDFGWNLRSLMKVTHVSRHDLEAIIGVDNKIMATAGRPALRIVR